MISKILNHSKSSAINVFVVANISSHPYLKLLYGNLDKNGIVCHDLKKNSDYQKAFVDDIIHLHWIEFHIRSEKGILLTIFKFTRYILFLIISKYIFRKKIIITLHNAKPHEAIYPTLEFLGFRLSLRIADALITHNEWSKKAALNYYNAGAKNIHVIPIGNFIGYYPNNITKKEARKKLHIPKDAFVILYFGLIRNYKGLDILLEAIKDLKKYNIFIMICGKPENENVRLNLINFEKNHTNCLFNLNYIPDDEIQHYMNASDIGILPYKEITTSAVLLLFASFNRTVIASDLEPIRETLCDAAIYYDPGNVEDLKRKILEANEKNLDAISEMSFEKATQYNWDDIATSTCRLYREVLKR